jgi:Planctomycete cytochrome C
MLSRPRSFLFGSAAFAVLLLLGLVAFLPPDGREHAELAQFLGRFHLLVIHLPIALLLLALLFEFAALDDRGAALRPSAEFVLALASLGVITSAWFGWLLAWSEGYEGELVRRHMWGGVSLAIASLACCWIFTWNRRLSIVALLATVGLMSWTSHQGGKLTHGTDYLTEHMPTAMRSVLGVTVGRVDSGVDPASFYATRVHPIFVDKCLLCHSSEKHKGGLRLDSYQNVMRGGKDGKVIQPGNTHKSELFRRITLPSDSKDFMPAEGKPALTKDETKVLELWIAAGAPAQVDEKSLAGLPAVRSVTAPEPKVADYRPQLKTITALETSLGVRLVPRSQDPTDGLILRTVNSPESCNDETLARLAPVGNLIADAELARTKVTDRGISILTKNFPNLRFLDLSYTTVTSAGMKEIVRLDKLESLNLTATRVDAAGVAELRSKPNLKKLYLFETH